MDEWYNVRYDGTDLDDGKAAVSITLASSGSTVTYSGSDISKFFSAKDGQYRISFVPTVSGVARLSVVLNGDEVVDQTTQRPWEIPVRAGEADAAKSSAYGTGASRALAGMEARFNVRLADAFDNTCEDSKVEDISLEFALVGSGPSLNAMTSSVVTTELGGHFIIVYTPPTHAEDYTIGVKVKLGTVSIQDLQVKVHKEAGEVDYASTVVTTATGAALESFTTSETSAGVAFSVYFQLVDASGVYVLDSPQADGWLQVTAVPPVKQTTLAEVSPGYYKADILAEELGNYRIKFAAGGVDLGKPSGISPPEYYLAVVPGWPSSAERSKHSFHGASLVAGIPFSFVVTAYDAFGNPQVGQSAVFGSEGFGASLYPTDDGMNTDSQCKATDNFDGTYGVTCSTTVAGEYTLQIYLDKAGNQRVLVGGANNLVVAIKPGQFSPADSAIIAVSSEIRAGERYTAVLQGRDVYSNAQEDGGIAFHVALADSESKSASMFDQKLVDRGDGTYELTFFLYQRGTYSLVVTEEVTLLHRRCRSRSEPLWWTWIRASWRGAACWAPSPARGLR